MSLPLGGFTSGKSDFRVSSLKCYDMQVLDKDCNLNISGTADINNIVVEDQLVVRDTLAVQCNLAGKGKLNVTGPFAVTGDMFTAADEFSCIATFQGTGNITIPVRAGLIPVTLQIESTPCSGNISVPDMMTGVVNYTPLVAPPRIDVYRYSAEDTCGVRHSVTQYICQQSLPAAPPFLNNTCASNFSFSFPIDISADLAASAMDGDFPIDWSTLTIKAIEAFSTTSIIDTEPSCSDIPMLPFGTFTSGGGVTILSQSQTGPAQFTVNTTAGTFLVDISDDGAGLLTGTFSGPSANLVSITLRVSVEVQDTMGNTSNCAFAHIGYWLLF